MLFRSENESNPWDNSSLADKTNYRGKERDPNQKTMDYLKENDDALKARYKTERIPLEHWIKYGTRPSPLQMFRSEDLSKARKALPVGTIRNWGGTDYIKHSDGWVVYTGKHQGKLMGKFKEDPKEHHKLFTEEHQKKAATPPPDSPSKEPTSPSEPPVPQIGRAHV